MTLKAALLQGQKLLDDAGVTEPRLTAEVLLSHATQHDRVWLTAHSTDELVELWWIHYGRYLHQRIEGMPTQYITGKQEFYGREFRVTPDVLIPRPETEHVIEAALAAVREFRVTSCIPRPETEHPNDAPPAAVGQAFPPAIVDVGTGSGAIAITLALETKAQVTATDISPAALRVAEENARLLNAQVHFVECDLIPEGKFDLIVSNPPYVGLTESLPREVRDHEPALALFAGDDGLDIYRRLIPAAARALNPNGWLMMEIGSSQAAAVSAMLNQWTDVRILNDLAGLPRVAIASFSK
jgi:release factor glutamine methyltransferase